MRVAMLTFYPLDRRTIPGGIRMVSYNLAEALRGYEDLDLEVIHCHSDVTQDAAGQEGRLRVRYLATPRQRLLPNLVTTVARLKGLLREIEPDVVHAHVGHMAYAAVRAGYPTIYTIHGVLSREQEIYSGSWYDRARYGLLAYYEKRALPHVRRLVAISPYVQAAYGHVRGVPWERINNPVPEVFFDVPEGGDPGALLYAGSITEIKDLLTLLRAVERLRVSHSHVHLRLAGRATSESYDRAVRSFVSERGLETNVTFLGLLDREQLLSEYARCSVVVLSSLQENAPIALIEGMAAGNPVVATRVGGVPDLVTDGETGLLAPAGDDGALAACLARLLDDDALRQRLGHQARREARERFAAHAVAQAYYALYRQVLDETRPTGGA
jgi:glycosyltransferase involved in cell wall biosynthesis